MKIVKKEQAEKFENAKNCVMQEYDFQDKDIDFSQGFVKGAYPKWGGYCVNQQCKEVIFVLKGFAEIESGGNLYCLHVGDALLIDKGERYRWTEKTDCEICAICTPAWTPEQHKIVEK